MKINLVILLSIALFQSQVFGNPLGFSVFMPSQNATISVAASVTGAGTAAGSSAGTGMYASAFANYETNRSTTEENATQSTQGILRAGGDITFTSGKDMKQEGTNVYASAGTLTYNITNDLTIQASKDTQSSESSS